MLTWILTIVLGMTFLVIVKNLRLQKTVAREVKVECSVSPAKGTSLATNLKPQIALLHVKQAHRTST